MADILTITGPNGFVAALLDAYGEGYQATIDDGAGNQIPNPQTKTAYARARLTGDIAGRIHYYQQNMKDREREQIPKLVLTFAAQQGV